MLAKLSARKDNNILFIEFTYHGIRFREHLGIKDTRNNRKIAKLKLERVNASLLDGDFDIQTHFPSSNNLQKFASIGLDRTALQASHVRSSNEVDSSPVASTTSYLPDLYTLYPLTS